MTKRRRFFRNSSAQKSGREPLKNSESPQDYVEVEEEILKRKRDLFASISQSLISERNVLKNSNLSQNTWDNEVKKNQTRREFFFTIWIF